MGISFSQLQCREVICLTNGQRLGLIQDIRIDSGSGQVLALVVPGPGKLFGMLGSREEYIIPWEAVKCIGPDIVFIERVPQPCRRSRL